MTRTKMKVVSIFSVLFLAAQSFISTALAASPGVNLGSIRIAPKTVSAGQYPTMEALLSLDRKARGKVDAVTIIAIVTQPDQRVRSWNWKKVRLASDAPRTISVPKEFDTSLAGTYRVEIVVYSDDMKRRLGRRVSQFDVIGRESIEQRPSGAAKVRAVDTAKQDRRHAYVGLGLYGNALNPAAGGTLLLWPSRYVGMQGIYSTGEFTSSEGRLLVKFEGSPTFSFYGGVGYMQVMTEKDIIGVTTRFEDGGISGVLGIEAALGKKVFLYLEASTARIDLKQTVTNNTQTVTATVKYAPVTVGMSIVMTLF